MDYVDEERQRRQEERKNKRVQLMCVFGAWMLWHCEVASDDEVILFRDKNIITWKGSMKRGDSFERTQNLSCRHGKEELYIVEEKIRREKLL